jgi:hypothetical protein
MRTSTNNTGKSNEPAWEIFVLCRFCCLFSLLDHDVSAFKIDIPDDAAVGTLRTQELRRVHFG